MALALVIPLAPHRTLAQANGCEGSAPEVATVSFEGNKRFVDGVESALGDIAKTPAGKALLDALANTDKPLKIQAPAISNAKSAYGLIAHFFKYALSSSETLKAISFTVLNELFGLEYAV